MLTDKLAGPLVCTSCTIIARMERSIDQASKAAGSPFPSSNDVVSAPVTIIPSQSRKDLSNFLWSRIAVGVPGLNVNDADAASRCRRRVVVVAGRVIDPTHTGIISREVRSYSRVASRFRCTILGTEQIVDLFPRFLAKRIHLSASPRRVWDATRASTRSTDGAWVDF